MRSPTSALAKLLAWDAEAPLEAHEVLAHQADFVAAQLCGTAEGGRFRSDWHNALKLGYDVRRTRCGYTYYGHTHHGHTHHGHTCQVRELRYPAWMEEGPLGKVLEG